GGVGEGGGSRGGRGAGGGRVLSERWRMAAGMEASANGHVVGVSDPVRRAAVLLDPDPPWRRTWLTEHRWVSAVAISPDGRWAATGSAAPVPDARELRIWDAADGPLAARPVVGNALA